MKKITRTICSTVYEIGVYNTETREVEPHKVESASALKEVEKEARRKLGNTPIHMFVYCREVGYKYTTYEMSLDDFIKNATISTKNQKEED